MLHSRRVRSSPSASQTAALQSHMNKRNLGVSPASFIPSFRPDHVCPNCNRLAGVNGQAVKADDGTIYCEINCYWSATLDVNGSRLLRERTRKRRSNCKCAVRPEVDLASMTPRATSTHADCSNAMFLYHDCNMTDSNLKTTNRSDTDA